MIDRRSLLFGAAALTSLPVTRSRAGAAPRSSSPTIRLWPGDAPGGGGPRGPLDISDKGAVSNVAHPFLTRHDPARPNGAAVLVAGGGGYKRIEEGSEARPAAQWLVEQGITAFVLTYRLPGEGWQDGAMAPVQDAQRALRLIRSQSPGLDPHRLGVLGFSSGGHLLGMASTRSGWRSYTQVDAADDTSARPDFAALIYPVVTLEPPYDDTSTRRQLVGNHPTLRESAEWSVETHVRRDCPPMFLVQADDDPISNPANTRILEAACRQAGVPVERHHFSSGGHGFGLGRPGTPTTAWPALYQHWLTGIQVLT